MLRRFFGEPITRDPEVSPRPANLAYFGRFADELLFGAVDVLKPTFVATFGLSYGQVGLLHLALEWVAGAVEPVSALLIDVWERRWLLAWGAAGIGLAVVLAGLAPAFIILLAAFAVYGAASGPLAHTADVVLVEAHPDAPTRAFVRATALDTTGALLGPACVALWVWAGLDWRWLLILLGSAASVYALLLGTTRFPRPRARRSDTPAHRQAIPREFAINLRAVAEDRAARTWLLFLFVHSVAEAPTVLKAVWLAEHGMGQALVGMYVTTESVASLLGVLYLGRRLRRTAARHVMLLAAPALIVLFPAWYFAPGIWPRFVIGAPLGFCFAVFWPIARSEVLTTASGRPGAVTAISAVMALAPLTMGVALLAEAVGLTPALLGTQWVGTVALFVIIWRWLPAVGGDGSGARSH